MFPHQNEGLNERKRGANKQQMMGPEAMGIKQQNYDWWDEKVCRNFLFGTCPHLVFGNTVSVAR